MKAAVIPDTNVFIHDPDAIENLRKKDFLIYLPWIVILELDKLKSRPDVSLDAREALKNIEESLKERGEHLSVIRRPSFRNLKELSKSEPDHQVIATGKTVLNMNKGEFREVKILSRDRPVRILANELGVAAEDYIMEEAQEEGRGSDIRTVNVNKEEIAGDTIPLRETYLKEDPPMENEGVVCYSDYDPFSQEIADKWRDMFAAVRKDDRLKLVPSDIEALGLRPFSLNGNGYNWHQHLALFQCLDPSIRLCFLQGGAGSGKTIISLASAILQRREFRQILITRPMVPLEDEDRIGTLPGDMEDKMSPWLQPIQQALNFLKELSPENKKLIERLLEERKINFAPLDYIRGMTFYKDFLIVDDAQNLTPHQVKTFITRAGMHAKMVFTGDLGQIDRKRRLDRRSSGLACAAERLAGAPLVSVIKFKETVRSPLAELAERYL